MGDEVKIGARNNATDRAAIQAAHDTMVSLGAECKDPSYIEMDADKSLVFFGGEVKALGEGKLGGYLVRFTTARDPDLTGDFFTAGTNYGSHKSTPVMYQHGMDQTIKGRVIGSGTLTPDNVGVWIEAQLEMRDEYEKAIYEMAAAGKLGWSSGTASHLVEREPHGKSWHITAWPLGLDASLTPTPAESRNSAVTLKSLIIGETPQEPDGALVDTASKTVETNLLKEGNPMPEFTEDQLKALISDAYKAGAEEVKRSEPATVTAGANIAVVKDAADQPFPMHQFFQAVKTAAIQPMAEDVRLRPLKATGMSEGVPADGGYLIPPATAGGIYQNMLSTGDLIGRVSSTPVSGNSMTWNLVDETSRASTLFGGVLGYWMSEGGTKTATAPKFKQFELKLKKIAALAYATDELLADATALNSWLTSNVPDVLRWQVEAAIYAGDGVGKPLGIITAPGLLSFARENANSVTYGDVVKMYARRMGNGPFVWYINRGVMVQLMQLAGTYQYLWLPPGGAAGSPNAQLLGFPVIEIDHAPALGTLGDIVLANPKAYQAITKGGVETATSIHVKFVTDETAFRFVMRYDGAPLLDSVFTPANGDTQAPFVALTAAS